MRKTLKSLRVTLLAFILVAVAVPVSAAGKDVRVYIERPSSEAGNKFYRGAKYEPVIGSYLGMFAEGDEAVHNGWTGDPFYFDGVPKLTGKKHALYMVYLRYGENDFNHYLSHYNKAKEANVGMQICMEPMGGLESVVDGEYLHRFAKQAKESGIPIFLRFANEMNDGSNPWGNKNPNLYKEKFRLVANIMHKEAPNVVMCWAPNDWPHNSSDKYYPGDDAVDWVGVSCYPPYTSNTKSKHNMKFSDKTKEIYDKYSGRKPVYLAEGAPIQNIEFQNSPSVTNVAAKETKEFYDEVARRYPGIKAIFYWSEDETHGAKRQCQLSNNPTVLNAYKKAISSPFFLSEVNKKSPVYYADVKHNIIAPESQKLSAFASINGRLDIGKVAYKINGKYIGEATGSPYEINYDFSNFSGKDIVIQADVYTTSNAYVTTENISTKVAKGETKIKLSPSDHSINLDGRSVEMSGYAIGGYNYFKLRDLAYALKDTNAMFDVGYDKVNNRITLNTEDKYQGNYESGGRLNEKPKVTVSSQSISVDGLGPLSMDAYLIDGNNYFKLADLGKKLGFGVEWDSSTKTVEIITN